MMISLLLIAAAGFQISSTTGFLGAIIIALIGTGGIGYFIDRRSVQAGRLAEEAAKATGVFTAALKAERAHRHELEGQLSTAKLELQKVLSRSEENRELINWLHKQVEALENDLRRSLADINEIIRSMFDGPATEYMVERWRAVMHATDLAVLQADTDGQIIYVSEEAERLLGYQGAELNGKSLISLIPDGDREHYLSVFLHASRVKTDEPLLPPISINILTKQSEVIPIHLAIAAHGDIMTLLIRRNHEANAEKFQFASASPKSS